MSALASAEDFNAHWPVSREKLEKLEHFAELIRAENRAQNLIGASTVAVFWDRHVLDSAQLVALASRGDPTWLDVGSGAGLPGIVTAILTEAEHILIEPRRRRAEFLARAISTLGLSARVKAVQSEVQKVTFHGSAIVTARAFASLTRTLEATFHLGGKHTRWLLHKGRAAIEEVVEAERNWSGRFELIPSITNPDGAIVRVSGLARKGSP